ncbi:uncharacterized protein B0P05DRAFT_551555 [Gilbertella persicaria]|uniref:BHLH domain-containing protein n=1 Tax=Rhizopus stolonifer TaxID=4846 RepID=A0A367J4W6_RHIST|nr:uncharacterized protein B0P05DRAFT_551555 [Gilbertella persicaria]KAI8069099.1 hypothetical protein B0P05DRAFT_551555 [Gilbertella persicaria]RCH84980.1 hypothetical protein CU098_004500 [Rhizopus stolonifer]
MDLSTFQLVDAMNDMDMLRNLSNQQESYSHHNHHQRQHQQQQHQQQQQQQQQQSSSANDNNAYDQLQDDIDLLFQPNHADHNISTFLPFKSSTTDNTPNQIRASPHYSRPASATLQNECYDQQEDIFTPLISPAMTPSYSYQVQQNKQLGFSSNNDMNFSPLSSPAILPQVDRHQKRATFQNQMVVTSSPNNNNTLGEKGEEYQNMSVNEICEQYEQLEQAKMIITQKLSELQKTQYHDDNYQRGLMSSESCLSRDSSENEALVQKCATPPEPMAMGHHMSKPNSPLQSPHMEPATPASLMNMKVNHATPSKLQFSSGRMQQFYPNTSQSLETSIASSMTYSPAIVSTSSTVFQPTISNAMHENNIIMSPMLTPTAMVPITTSQPTTTAAAAAAPPSPLALHPRRPSSRPLKSEKSIRHKKQRRESIEPKIVNGIHASPRALKPLLISPTLNPGLKPLPSSMVSATKANTVHSVEDAEHILATRSNYQNLMEGKGAALGIAFSTQIKSGLEVRRTAHKAAEQKRRDSLKEWFDRLRREVEDGYVKRQKSLMSQIIKEQELEKSITKKAGTEEEATEEGGNEETTATMKPLSKVLLLQYAYEYIASLKTSLEEKDAIIESLTSGSSLKRKQDDEEELEESKQGSSNESVDEMKTIPEE